MNNILKKEGTDAKAIAIVFSLGDASHREPSRGSKRESNL
jgi:hypothetical protein